MLEQIYESVESNEEHDPDSLSEADPKVRQEVDEFLEDLVNLPKFQKIRAGGHTFAGAVPLNENLSQEALELILSEDYLNATRLKHMDGALPDSEMYTTSIPKVTLFRSMKDDTWSLRLGDAGVSHIADPVPEGVRSIVEENEKAYSGSQEFEIAFAQAIRRAEHTVNDILPEKLVEHHYFKPYCTLIALNAEVKREDSREVLTEFVGEALELYNEESRLEEEGALSVGLEVELPYTGSNKLSKDRPVKPMKYFSYPGVFKQLLLYGIPVEYDKQGEIAVPYSYNPELQKMFLLEIEKLGIFPKDLRELGSPYTLHMNVGFDRENTKKFQKLFEASRGIGKWVEQQKVRDSIAETSYLLALGLTDRKRLLHGAYTSVYSIRYGIAAPRIENRAFEYDPNENIVDVIEVVTNLYKLTEEALFNDDEKISSIHKNFVERSRELVRSRIGGSGIILDKDGQVLKQRFEELAKDSEFKEELRELLEEYSAQVEANG